MRAGLKGPIKDSDTGRFVKIRPLYEDGIVDGRMMLNYNGEHIIYNGKTIEPFDAAGNYTGYFRVKVIDVDPTVFYIENPEDDRVITLNQNEWEKVRRGGTRKRSRKTR